MSNVIRDVDVSFYLPRLKRCLSVMPVSHVPHYAPAPDGSGAQRKRAESITKPQMKSGAGVHLDVKESCRVTRLVLGESGPVECVIGHFMLFL